MSVLLASASPQRRAILAQVGVRFRVWEPHVEEITEGDPAHVALVNSRMKAGAGSDHAAPGELVVGVDTVVALDGRLFGKPASIDEAREMLLALRGRTHTVISGITVRSGDQAIGATPATSVVFRDFTDAALDSYLETSEWVGRAGGYAIQGRGAALVSRVAGDFYNVVGFPLADFLDIVDEQGLHSQVFEPAPAAPR